MFITDMYTPVWSPRSRSGATVVMIAYTPATVIDDPNRFMNETTITAATVGIIGPTIEDTPISDMLNRLTKKTASSARDSPPSASAARG